MSTPNPYRRIAISFIIAAVAVTFLILYYTLARATITLELEAENEILETNISANTVPSENTLTAVIYSREITTSKTYYARGTGDTEEKASGTVTVYNTNNAAQTLIANTRLLSSGNVLFRITKQINVAAGGSVNVEAIADLSGTAGEIEPTKFTIPGLNTSLQQKIYAESKEKMVRRERAGSKILASDIEDARNNIKELITQQGLAELREQLPEDKRQLNVVYKTDIIKATPSASADAEVSQFDFEMTAKITAVFYDATQLRDVTLAGLNNETADTGKQVLSLDEQSLAVSIKDAASDNSSAELTVKFLGHVSWNDLAKIINRDDLLGRTQAEVENYFSAFAGVKSVEVKLTPFWVTTVPTIADHIELNIK